MTSSLVHLYNTMWDWSQVKHKFEKINKHRPNVDFEFRKVDDQDLIHCINR